MDWREAKEVNFTFFSREENYLLQPVIFSFRVVLMNTWSIRQNHQVFFRTNCDFDIHHCRFPPRSLPKRAGLPRNASDGEAKLFSPVYPSVFAGCLGYKLQGWLCCPLLSQRGILLHNQCSALHLQLRAGVRFFVTNISQGLGPTPSLPQHTDLLDRSVY